MGTGMYERDYAIDALRTVGLLCIILAHVSPNSILFDLRNFDVVCMVVITGMSYCISSRKEEKYSKYILKRFKRLVIPTWIFLTFFFLLFNLLGKINDKICFDFNTYKTSYLLIGGIGFVWIIRVYFLIAIINPGIKYISKSIQSNLVYMVFVATWFFTYQFFIMKTGDYSACFAKIDRITGGGAYTDILLYMLGYGLIAALGYRYKSFKCREKICLILVNVIFYFGFILKNGYTSTQNYKYPPRMYYISYGLMVTFILYEIFSVDALNKIVQSKVICWISKNSMWIYLWHIIPVKILLYYDVWKPVRERLVFRYLFCVVVAVIITMLQNYIKKLFISRMLSDEL
jgi:fucose 4-O-acetylase-like acetyltransferase